MVYIELQLVAYYGGTLALLVFCKVNKKLLWLDVCSLTNNLLLFVLLVISVVSHIHFMVKAV